MKLEIIPYKSIGELDLLSNRSIIIKILGRPNSSFTRNLEKDKETTDEYLEFGFFAYYNQKNILEAIEAWEDADIWLGDICFFNNSIRTLTEKFRELDNQLEEDTEGFVSYKMGIGAWHPNKRENLDFPFESIIIFKKGYYN